MNNTKKSRGLFLLLVTHGLLAGTGCDSMDGDPQDRIQAFAEDGSTEAVRAFASEEPADATDDEADRGEFDALDEGFADEGEHPSGGPEGLAGSETEEIAVPVAQIELAGGHTLTFFAEDDGTLGVTSLSPAGHNALERADLQQLSPAEVFWAVSEPGSPIPEKLAWAHDEVAGTTGFYPYLAMTTASAQQGWARGSLMVKPNPQMVSCANFCANHCPYATGSCRADNTGSSWTHLKSQTDKYYGAICVDSGTVTDELKYKRQDLACALDSSFTTVWNTNFSAGQGIVYNWVSPYNPPWALRRFEHRLTNGSGDVWNFSSCYELGDCVN